MINPYQNKKGCWEARCYKRGYDAGVAAENEALINEVCDKFRAKDVMIDQLTARAEKLAAAIYKYRECFEFTDDMLYAALEEYRKGSK